MSLTDAPIDGLTNDNRGGVVIVFVIVAGFLSVFFAILRFATAKRLDFGADDTFFILSLVNLPRIATLPILTTNRSWPLCKALQ